MNYALTGLLFGLCYFLIDGLIGHFHRDILTYALPLVLCTVGGFFIGPVSECLWARYHRMAARRKLRRLVLIRADGPQ